MYNDKSHALFSAVLRSKAVTKEDMVGMRAVIFERGLADHTEAEVLLALDHGPVAQMPGWSAFFIEALTDFVLWQSRPTGRVTESDLDWLLGCLGDWPSANAAALLGAIARDAHEPPARLQIVMQRRAA
jgi:hypothetical protein